MGKFVAASVTEPRIRPTVWPDSETLPNISATDAPIMARTVNARMGSLLRVSDEDIRAHQYDGHTGGTRQATGYEGRQ
jgi:hypothetical protein